MDVVPPQENGRVPAEQIRQKVQDVLARDDYDLTATGRVSNEFLEFFDRLKDWLLTPLHWLLELTKDLPDALRWFIVVGLLGLMFLLIGHIIYTLARAVSSEGRRSRAVDDRYELDQATMSAADLESLAEQAASRQDFIGAVRLLLRASLVRLEELEQKPFRRGTTGREHLRRYRGTPLFAPLEVLVRTIELKWFGEQICAADDLDRCRISHQDVTEQIRRQLSADAS